ncbi:MAG: carboxymuconolactone decarboxylase, partial [Comamonadaceae bacterium]
CGVPVANHAFGIAAGILREKGLLPDPPKAR